MSRKTPLDGRLEIPESVADRLTSIAQPLTLLLHGVEAPVQVDQMACTCAKGAGGNHLHHFLAGEVLKTLPPSSNVNVAVDVDRGHIRIDFDS